MYLNESKALYETGLKFSLGGLYFLTKGKNFYLTVAVSTWVWLIDLNPGVVKAKWIVSSKYPDTAPLSDFPSKGLGS